MKYADKLKHPKWQRRRLEILERDGFACRKCGSEEDTLVIHHLYYRRGRDPWDYEDDVLVTLCMDCHQDEHAEANAVIDIGQALLMAGLWRSDITRLCDAIRERGGRVQPWFSDALVWMLSDPAAAELQGIIEAAYFDHIRGEKDGATDS